MSLNKKYLTLFLLVFFQYLLLSQEVRNIVPDSIQIENLEEVLITATRTLRQLSAVPLPTQIVSKKEIRSINSIRLSDILEEQTGLITIPDFGGGEGIQMQGLDSQYVLILIDGVPLVGRSAGTFDLNRLSVGNIKQIEVIKGASSSLYGNEAMGGVINIITEKPKRGFDTNVNYRMGSFNTQDFGSNLQTKTNHFGISFFFNRNSSDGYDLNNDDEVNTVEPFINHTLSTNITYEISDKTDLILNGRYYNQQQDIVQNEDRKGESSINEWNLNIRAEHEFNDKWKSYLELYGTNYVAQEFTTDDVSDEIFQTDFNQRFLRPELRTTYAFNNNSEIITGLGLTNEQLERSLFSTTPVFNAPYIYAQYDGEILEDINMILGVRFDAHNEYQSQLSPKLALQYASNEKLKFKASLGYGFKAPDFRQLYLDFSNSTVGYTVIGYNEIPRRLQELYNAGELNINSTLYPTVAEQQVFINTIIDQYKDELKAESSVGINLGAEYKPNNRLRFNFNAFRNIVNNLIETQAVIQRTNGQNVFSYSNLSKVVTQGIELDARFEISSKLTISGGYQLLYAFDKDARTEFERGNIFARDPETLQTFRLEADDYFGLFNRSRHNGNLKVFYVLPEIGLDANIRGVYRSKFGLFDTNGNTYLDNYDEFVGGHIIWDVAVNKSFWKNYKIGVGVDNIFNFTNTQITNLPGRIFYANMNINF